MDRNVPVGVQAARIKLNLAASLRAAWTSTSPPARENPPIYCLKSKAPENQLSRQTCVGGFELQILP